MSQSTLARLVLQHDSSDQQVVTLSSALWERIAPVDLGEKGTRLIVLLHLLVTHSYISRHVSCIHQDTLSIDFNTYRLT